MKVAYRTDLGMKRLNNEDSILVTVNQANVPIYLVCDGVGGQKSGEVASKMTCQYLGDLWVKTTIQTEEDAKHWLSVYIEKINQQVFLRAKQFDDLQGMSTTLVAAVVLNNRLLVAHVGDSRAYVFRSPQLKQLTKDHSLVNELLSLGGLSEEEAKHHPMKHVITQAIGSKETVKIDLTSLTLKDNDYLLLCTDGLTDMLPFDYLSSRFKKWLPLKERVDDLIEQANAVGGRDNITVLVAHYREVQDKKGVE